MLNRYEPLFCDPFSHIFGINFVFPFILFLKVELVTGKGVFISLSEKEQLKVDLRNKPTSLARETLFALYGRDVFQVLTITARGQKKGSYTFPDSVLKAVCGMFIIPFFLFKFYI